MAEPSGSSGGERAPAFEPGNGAALTHGAYSPMRLVPRAVELADWLRGEVPVRTGADEPTIRLLALTLARIEAAETWLDREGLTRAKGEPWPLVASLVSWTNTAIRLCDRLLLNPEARTKAGVQVAQTHALAGRGSTLRVSPSLMLDLSKLDDDELETLRVILEKASGPFSDVPGVVADGREAAELVGREREGRQQNLPMLEQARPSDGQDAA